MFPRPLSNLILSQAKHNTYPFRDGADRFI